MLLSQYLQTQKLSLKTANFNLQHLEVNQKYGVKVILPTLLNASDHTRFVYEVTGITESQARQANLIDSKGKVLDRVAFVYQNGGRLNFIKADSDQFKKNLRRVDTAMDRIVAELLKYSYLSNKRELSVITKDPVFGELLSDLELAREDYEFKIKNLLWAVALGE